MDQPSGSTALPSLMAVRSEASSAEEMESSLGPAAPRSVESTTASVGSGALVQPSSAGAARISA